MQYAESRKQKAEKSKSKSKGKSKGLNAEGAEGAAGSRWARRNEWE